MTFSQQNAQVRKKLTAMLEETIAAGEAGAESGQTVELDQARIGRLSRMDALQTQAMSRATNRRRSENILRIRAALKRLDADEYGRCVRCGDAINPKRLELDPATALCIACAESAEQPRR
jgi:DnaK suppressor protein